jgi:hypothetical protein
MQQQQQQGGGARDGSRDTAWFLKGLRDGTRVIAV